jgi:lysophospholipase L1-like esterase
MTNVILIGDSIRLGYQATVSQLLRGQAQVWAPAENGGTSRNVLAHLDEWVLSREPDILHLNCGLHDLRTEFGATTQAVPLDEYESNLRQIVSTILDQGSTTLIWAATTPVNEQWHHENKAFDRFEANVRAYNDSAQRVATAYGVQVNDLYQVVMDAGRDQVLIADGVHFGEAGYALLGQAVADSISTLL